MKARDLVQDIRQFAEADLKGHDMEVVLFNRATGEELIADPDSDKWDFEVLRGDGKIVIEFN